MASFTATFSPPVIRDAQGNVIAEGKPSHNGLDTARIRARVAKVRNVIELLELLNRSPSFHADLVGDDETIGALRDSLVARVLKGEIEEFALPCIPPAELAAQQARALFREIVNEVEANVNSAAAADRARKWAQQWLEAHKEA